MHQLEPKAPLFKPMTSDEALAHARKHGHIIVGQKKLSFWRGLVRFIRGGR